MLSYNRGIIHGQGLFDYLWIKNNVDTQSQIESTISYNYSPVWDANTRLLAEYINGLSGGNIESLKDDVIAWQVYRIVNNSPTLEFVTKTKPLNTSILDFNVEKENSYEYIVFAETNNYLSAPIPQLDTITPTWDCWSICAIELNNEENNVYNVKGNTWIFNSNLSSGTNETQLSKYTFQPFTQFPKISNGQRNYITGNVSALLGNYNPITGVYEGDTIANVDAFRKFCASSDLKLLKNRKGQAWIVQTMTSVFETEDDSPNQNTTISFEFIQVDDLKNKSIIKL